MGLCVASFALLGLSLWLILLVFGIDIVDMVLMHEHIGMVEGFATGASAVALFARVGGGIYTKAADVGADLVGKVEAGIPEDDPRNPATIADNVGDNVGDVAGMGADLFESYTGAILAPTILAVTFGSIGGYFATGDLVWAIVTPVIIAACGIITSIIGLFAVRTKEGAELHKALNRGTYVAAGIEIVAIFCLFMIWQSQSADAQPIWLFGSVVCGLVAGLAIGKITEYFCSDKYKPVHKIAEAADTGAATVIIEGLGTGMLSTIAPIVLVRWPSSAPSRAATWRSPTSSLRTAASPWACSASALPRRACCPTRPSPWAWTPTAPWPTMRAASPRWRACPKRCAGAPTRWTPWATRRPPSRRASPLPARALRPSRCSCPTRPPCTMPSTASRSR